MAEQKTKKATDKKCRECEQIREKLKQADDKLAAAAHNITALKATIKAKEKEIADAIQSKRWGTY